MHNQISETPLTTPSDRVYTGELFPIAVDKLPLALAGAAQELKRIEREHSDFAVSDYISPKELGDTAFKYFINAAMKYPSSVTMQGLQVAKLAEDSPLRDRMPPTQRATSLTRSLRIQIHDDPTIITKAADVALKVHKKHRSTVPRHIVIERSFLVIDSVFQVATALNHAGITSKVEREMQDLYTSQHTPKRHVNSEQIIRRRLLELIEVE